MEEASYGWTYPDAHKTCQIFHRYTSFENPDKTLLVVCVCNTNDADKTSIEFKGRKLVTTTEDGSECSGRVGKWVGSEKSF